MLCQACFLILWQSALSSLFQWVHRVLSQACFGSTQSTLSCLFSNTMAECCILMLTYHSVKPVLGSTQSTLSSLFSILWQSALSSLFSNYVAECCVKPISVSTQSTLPSLFWVVHRILSHVSFLILWQSAVF